MEGMADPYLAPAGTPPFFLDVPFDQRWKFLKPVICELYLNQNKTLPEVVRIMNTQYRFFAFDHQYKYHLENWGISKNLPLEIKEAAVVGIRKRIRDSDRNVTPTARYRGQEIPKKKLRRYVSDLENKQKRDEVQKPIQLSQNIFITWNLPYRAFVSAHPSPDNSSPFYATPAGLTFSPHDGYSQTSISSPANAPTPTVLAIRSRSMNERTDLLVEGRKEELFKQLTRPERKSITTWLYQFWLFSFKTAKHWGFGPMEWTAERLNFDGYEDREIPGRLVSSTPRLLSQSPWELFAHDAYLERSSGLQDQPSEPSPLCRWSIHAFIRNRYEMCDDPTDNEFELSGDGEPWPSAAWQQAFEDKLKAALENNSFSNLDIKDLPIAISRIIKAARGSRTQLLQESFSFSIIARNEAVFWRLLPEVSEITFVDTGIYPLHLLTSFLDGSKTCCNLFDAAMNGLADCEDVKKLYTNNFGHTVLDNLMITILKGHTNCTPVVVDDNFAKRRRFDGEEVDICGRWDADSHCVRELFASGRSRIPFHWKHMFCHTSVQTICHCIGRLFGPVFAPNINTPSGLFKKRCQHCQRELQLLPLHTLVLIAYYLARDGCEDENLFGMLACLVCLLTNGADPTRKAAISLKALMGRDNATECSHEDLDPFELAHKVPESLLVDSRGLEWNGVKKLGWQLLCRMLEYSRDERRTPSRPAQSGRTSNVNAKDQSFSLDSFMGYNDDNEWAEMVVTDNEEEEEGQDFFDTGVEDGLCSHSKESGNFYGGSKVIGRLWATIQAELLTYRRIAESDPWLSENFSLHAVLDGLNSGGLIFMPLLNDNMINDFCPCGRFRDVRDEACPCLDEVCQDYFANFEIWDRTTYIIIPVHGNDFWYL